jgi:hypothetical protein
MIQLLNLIYDEIKPHRPRSDKLSSIIAESISLIKTCYKNISSDRELCSIVHTHCYNSTYTTKKALKQIVQKHLSSKEYSLYGVKLQYAILDIGTKITMEGSIFLTEQMNMTNTDPNLEKIAKRVLDKVNVDTGSDPNVGFVDPLTIIIVIGVILSLIRVIQECRQNKLSGMNNESKADLIQSEIKTFVLKQSWINQLRMNRVIKRKLTKEQYKKYGKELKQALLAVGSDLSNEEVMTLVGAANV